VTEWASRYLPQRHLVPIAGLWLTTLELHGTKTPISFDAKKSNLRSKTIQTKFTNHFFEKFLKKG
jgi:hypothetical protein